MKAVDLARAGALAATLLAVTGCMSSQSPEHIEASGQDLSGLPAFKHAHATQADTAMPAIFESPDVSVANRKKLGDDYASQVLKNSKRSADTVLEAKLQRVVDDLAAHIAGDRFEYRLYLLDNPTPNAFTTGGGHIFVTTGLVAQLQSEAQMAAVIGHEMAHSSSAHVVKGAHGQKLVQQTAAFSENVMHQRWGVPWLGNSIKFLVSTSVNKYTREQEDDADEIGLHAMVAAGYDPREAANAVKALSAGIGNQSEVKNFFFGRHSTAKSRIWRFGNLIRAYYPKLDMSSLRRSTGEYDQLAGVYWSRRKQEVPQQASAG
jgi:predicted Zn-dependent protease